MNPHVLRSAACGKQAWRCSDLAGQLIDLARDESQSLGRSLEWGNHQAAPSRSSDLSSRILMSV